MASYYIARRKFLATLGGAAVAWPLAARAQQPVMPVIGYLGFTSPSDEVEMISSVRKGLREAGFDEGRNVSIEFRFAEGEPTADVCRRTRQPQSYGHTRREYCCCVRRKNGDVNGAHCVYDGR